MDALDDLVVEVDGQSSSISFAVMSPLLQRLEDVERLLVADLIVKFGAVEVKCNRDKLGGRKGWQTRACLSRVTSQQYRLQDSLAMFCTYLTIW